MKRAGIKLHSLQNAEHFEFHADVLAEIGKTTPAALKSVEQCAEYAAAFRREDGIMKQIRADALTAEIATADHARDVTFHGLTAAWEAAMHHFDPATAAAAHRLEPVFRTYGNAASEALAKESADIFNLLQELAEKHTVDVETLELVPWIAELDRRNVAVETLMRRRYGEQAERPAGSLREARLEVDAAFYTVVDRVEALSLVEGGAVYDGFIARVNAIIERAMGILAARRGRAAAAKAREQAEAAATEQDTATAREH
ncbi:MAG: DUF6261 family protein [Alistipes sp.]|jgi:hypothetical protein|nr:DUF6261 family protein [Alistipes sp.]